MVRAPFLLAEGDPVVDFDRAGRFLAANQILGPAASMQGRVDQFGVSVGLGEGHKDRMRCLAKYKRLVILLSPTRLAYARSLPRDVHSIGGVSDVVLTAMSLLPQSTRRSENKGQV